MKKIFILYVLCMYALTAFPQMSDELVIENVKQLHASGASQQQIAEQLLLQGVDQQQIERIRTRIQQSDNASTTMPDIDRSRIANGETVATVKSESGASIFGHDIFRSTSLTFEPNMNIPTPAEYVLGPGDEVILDIYGASQSSDSYKISPDGTITIHDIGPVAVSGMTTAEAQSKIRNRLGSSYRDSNIKVSVGQTRTVVVNVMGEVAIPGTYKLSAFSTVFNALYLAGGVTDMGTVRDIKVSRNGRIISTIDVYEFILNGRLPGNIMLADNDVIMVGPYVNLVTVEGKVKRPMTYELKDNETLQQLLTFAGGFTGDAFKQRVRVERIGDDGLTVHNVEQSTFSQFQHADRDIIVVSSVIERFRNTVVINGAVFRPGKYKLGNEVNSVKTLVEHAGGLLEQAFVTRAVIQRKNKDRSLRSITVDLDGILSGSVADIVLENEDELYVSSQSELIESRYMTIQGEVMSPGNYKYADNTTIEDLITLAGGLKESASLLNIEVARRITSADDNANDEKIAKLFSLSLTEGLQIASDNHFLLQPYDLVTIHSDPYYKVQKCVYVTGEIQFAGEYVLENKNERLSNLVRRAGGVTSQASIEGARLLRTYSREEQEHKLQLLEMAETQNDSLAVLSQINKSSYSIGIDLAKALQHPGSEYDVVLAEGDVLQVPQLKNVVKISGDVLYPNTVTYNKGKGFRYYINQAGGAKKTAHKRKAYIVYANGQVAKARRGRIEPGCEIIVPQKIKKEQNPQLTSIWIGGVTALASIVAVVAAIIK